MPQRASPQTTAGSPQKELNRQFWIVTVWYPKKSISLAEQNLWSEEEAKENFQEVVRFVEHRRGDVIVGAKIVLEDAQKEQQIIDDSKGRWHLHMALHFKRQV